MKNGVRLMHVCGAHTLCATCRVVVESGADNLSPMRGTENLAAMASLDEPADAPGVSGAREWTGRSRIGLSALRRPAERLEEIAMSWPIKLRAISFAVTIGVTLMESVMAAIPIGLALRYFNVASTARIFEFLLAGGVRFALDFDLFARASGPLLGRATRRRSMNSNLPRWIVPILWILAAMDIVNGIEMFFFPAAWFFRLVPGVPETGPYNMHLVMDGGTFFLAVGAGLAAAALNPAATRSRSSSPRSRARCIPLCTYTHMPRACSRPSIL